MTIGARPFGRAPLGGSGFIPVPSSQLALQIGPLDVTPFLRRGTYSLRQELNGRDELEFTLISTTAYAPAIGENVFFSIGQGLLFAGSVHECDVEFVAENRSDYTRARVRCVDLSELADRRVVVEIYEQMSAGAIVRDIVGKYLFPELVQMGDIQEGPMVERVVFAYQTAARCFDDLCEASGFHWTIDQQRAVSFFARTSSPAPFTITSANAVFRRLQARRTRNQYRNVQYVAGGHGVTDPRTEPFRGDGTRATFTVEYPIFAAPSIQVNFQPQTVGIRGVDTVAQWFWNKGENTLGYTGTTLTSADVVLVSYRGLFQLIEVVEDTAAILERQAAQGLGTGRYELLESDSNLDGQALTEEKGLSLLRRYASLDTVVDFETDVPGLGIGQLVPVNAPEVGCVGTFFITHLETRPLLPNARRFQVTATTGELKSTFQELFQKMLASSQPISIRSGEILQEVMGMHDPVGVTDSIDATLADFAEGQWGVGDVGTAEMGP